jgi:tRNA-specific 2-thiouridylase
VAGKRKPEGERKPGAIVLLSGGLDSVLAAALLRRLGLRVVGMSFVTPFFGSDKAERAAETLGIDLVVRDIGKNMNPCIDCHGLMVKKAMESLAEADADFVATGEVLGERPKSQNRQSLDIVARLSGERDLLVRPLSARLLPATRPEVEGLIKREDLLDLQGRSRTRQMQLAAEWGIDEYESPAGGCLLTDANIGSRLKELMRRQPGFDTSDALLVSLGRQQWSGDTLIVVGRRHEENERLKEIALLSDYLLKDATLPGPLALLRSYPRGTYPDEKSREEAARLLGIYGKEKRPLLVDEVIDAREEK